MVIFERKCCVVGIFNSLVEKVIFPTNKKALQAKFPCSAFKLLQTDRIHPVTFHSQAF